MTQFSKSTHLSSRPSRAGGAGRTLLLTLILGGALVGAGCSDKNGDSDGGGGGGGDAGDGGGLDGLDNLDLGISNPCDAGVRLPGLSGVVYAPNGKDPLPGALIYVAKGTPASLSSGDPCDVCKIASTAAWAQTYSSATGAFKLRRVPVGDLTVVIQIGRFRRIASVTTSCGQDLALTSSQSRLPGTSKEGDIPRVAVATGLVDKMEYLLTKIGLTEYTLIEGRSSTSSTTYPKLDAVLSDASKLQAYDILLLNCSNGFDTTATASATAKNLQAFIAGGGRLFVDDLAYEFVEWPFPTAVDFEPDAQGTYLASSSAQEPAGSAELGVPTSSIDATVVQNELKQWLGNFAGVLNSDNTVPIEGWLSHWAVMHAAPTEAKVWVQGSVAWYASSSSSAGSGVRPLSVSMDPVGANGKRCGRVAFNSYHTVPNKVSPTDPFNSQERILEYLFFKVASCMGLY
jgi:hypothetical protein